MDKLVFGKLAIRLENHDDFMKEAKASGLHVDHIQANIYEISLKRPSLLDEEMLRKKVGALGLKYGDL